MIDTNTRNLATEVRNLPPSMLDASLLAEYVKTGVAYDLSALCKKADVSLIQVAQIIVACGLDEVDKLPGYAVTQEVFDLAENLYSIGESRRQWQLIRNRHKPEYLEGRLSREALKRLELDPTRTKRHYADIFFRAWAVFWDDGFLDRMIHKVDSRIIASIPEALLTKKICFTAVSKSGLALRYVPESMRSLAVCAQAVQNNAAAIAFTPAPLRDQIKHLQATGFE
ncbi:MAG: hypothetical protein OES20_15160 [Gammaproteobacteria bacterium]|nr:hypothetical protein [Gammaproteobacteria bacterium]MDH3858258.1 hypothetical protein [Gammaproteobacteria bacterium]